MRLFLAVTLPDDVRDSIGRATAEVRATVTGVRWVRPELLHLTVKFLGERADGDERRLEGALRSPLVRVPGCEATIRGAGAFPNFRRPRVVWLGMHPLAPLAAMARQVDDALVPLGIQRESRPFRGHITLGRVEHVLATNDAASLERTVNALRDTWTVPVRDVALVHSTLARGGPTYRVLERFPLGIPGAP